MVELITDAVLDTAKMLPILFLTYVFIHLCEKYISLAGKAALMAKSKVAPIAGALAGIVPQCGFSAMASALFAKRIITAGTLIAVFLSTSDEAIPVLLAGGNTARLIFPLLLAKLIIAAVFGLTLDGLLSTSLLKSGEKQLDNNNMQGNFNYNQGKSCQSQNKTENSQGDNCQSHNHIDENHLHIHKTSCACNAGGANIFLSSLKRSLNTGFFIFIVNLGLNFALQYADLSQLASFGGKAFSPFIWAVVGLVPNCSVSILITRLYAGGLIPFGCAISGLCAGAGTGLAVLYKENKNIKQNIKITALLWLFASLAGLGLTVIW